ncbi:putative glycoside hydrolase family 93 protein [Diaporthe ampelina]|uniref:Putative glycoside hydrolase family 93 protein n=1 Tax=Diaporthe ampelina TaxID=1214573 RepID=A0A0G2FPB6_9PEZI|nr:putative glycoside hydrolase family 93 protein [Diaporthe ampelina]
MLGLLPATCLAILALFPQHASPQGLLQPLPPQGFGALECLPITASNASVEIYPAGDPVTLETTGVYLRASGSVRDGLCLGYAVREGFTKILRTYSSADGGDSWQRLGDVERGDNRTRELDNAFPLVLPAGFPGTGYGIGTGGGRNTANSSSIIAGRGGDGAAEEEEEEEEEQQQQDHRPRRILYAYRNHDRSLNSTLGVPDNYTFYRLTVSASDDGGRSWAFLSHIDTRAANNGSANLNGLWEPFLRVAADGATLQAFYSAENDAGDQDSLLRESRDGGRTWGRRRVASGAERVRSRDGMTGVARLGGGGDDSGERLMLLFETTESGRFDMRRVLSPDGGRTWPAETRARVYDPLDEERQASAPAGVINVGGTLVAGFMTNEGTNSSGAVPGDFKVVSSVDDGETWSKSVLIAREAVWPGLYSLGRDRFLAMYSFDTHEGEYVAATRVFALQRG